MNSAFHTNLKKGGEREVKITIEGEAKEIAALVVTLHGQQVLLRPIIIDGNNQCYSNRNNNFVTNNYNGDHCHTGGCG